MNPKASGFIAAGGNDAPANGVATDDQRLTAEFQSVALEVSWQKWTLLFHATVLQKDCAKMTGAK